MGTRHGEGRETRRRARAGGRGKGAGRDGGREGNLSADQVERLGVARPSGHIL